VNWSSPSYGTAAVAIHALVSGLHGWAHLRLGVALSPFQAIFVALVITAAPIVAAALLWTRHARFGAVLLFASMAGALAFGLYFHYIAISPDHVPHLRGAARSCGPPPCSSPASSSAASRACSRPARGGHSARHSCDHRSSFINRVLHCPRFVIHSPMTIRIPSHLTNSELMADMNRRAGCEREDVAHLIADIAEFDARDGHLAAGYSSLYVYCREVLKLSEFEAYLRIEVARLARRFPLILTKLAEGSLNLTNVRLLAPQLRPDNYQDLLDEASGKSKREVKEQVTALAPRPDTPLRVRWLSDPSPQTIAPAATPHPATSASPSPPPPRPRLKMTPLSSTRCTLEFTANRSTYDKFEQARDLLSHAVRDRDPGEVIDRALTLLIKDIERKKNGATDRTRPSRGTKPGSRRPSAAARRVVWKRDGGRCAFVGQTGHRCNERSSLQYHHLDRDGPATPENMELRCAPHNRYEAGIYGPAKLKYMGVVSERRASYSAAATWSGPSSRMGIVAERLLMRIRS